MAALFTVKYRTGWRWSSFSGIAYFTVAALLPTAASIYAWIEPEQRGSLADSIILAGVTLVSWLLVAVLATLLLARRRRDGEAALLVDMSDVTIGGWRARKKLLRWDEIDCFHLLEVNGDEMIFIELSKFPNKLLRISTRELDEDPQVLLRELERARLTMTAGS